MILPRRDVRMKRLLRWWRGRRRMVKRGDGGRVIRRPMILSPRVAPERKMRRRRAMKDLWVLLCPGRAEGQEAAAGTQDLRYHLCPTSNYNEARGFPPWIRDTTR